jgi:hypothetical protein
MYLLTVSPVSNVELTHAQVRAHRHNPVAWQLWDGESMDLARRHNRLIFLSIGYSACHCMSEPCVTLTTEDCC